MKLTGKWRNSTRIAAVLGIVGLAAFGVYRTVNAATDIAAENNAALATPASPAEPGSGSGCSPYGCAACASCTLLQYPPTIEVTVANNVVSGL